MLAQPECLLCQWGQPACCSGSGQTEQREQRSNTSGLCRRDFTINSLFYRIDSGEVEDFSGRGLADLAAQLIRTPLPASETFMDGAHQHYMAWKLHMQVLAGIMQATVGGFCAEIMLAA